MKFTGYATIFLFKDEKAVRVYDAHTLHERELFHGLMAKRDYDGLRTKQKLLFPLQLDWIEETISLFDGFGDVLSLLGWTFERQGTTMLLTEIPCLLQEQQRYIQCLREIVGAIGGCETRRLKPVVAAIMACHAAVRVDWSI